MSDANWIDKCCIICHSHVGCVCLLADHALKNENLYNNSDTFEKSVCVGLYYINSSNTVTI